MKKLLVSIILILILLSCGSVYATEIDYLNTTTAGELVEMKESSSSMIKEFEEKYGSKTFGLVAFVLNGLRIYSIPLCFIGIAVGAIFQYVIGIRKLDVRDKGFALIITFVTVLLICQVLPLIFTIVVNGWRG